jgi:hypothetical protein
MNTSSLQEEIDRVRAQVQTDGYPVSIGEWISIFEKNELDIHPEFQRFFRWSSRQKSRLVESVLLGIPIPQIFVAQRPDGVWDVVDGLQRLSTIFEFVGILKTEVGESLPALTLESTKYLPSLGGKRWQDEKQPKHSLTTAQRLLIKRSKIGVSIILKESDDAAKYELFQRLNAGGSQLSDQELRNSIIVMLNRDFYSWMEHLSQDQGFQEAIALTDRATEERYDMELALRFLVFRTAATNSLKNVGDMGEYLTDKAAGLAQDKKFDRATAEDAFRKTFALLREQAGSDSCRRYDADRQRFVGGFSVSAFEAVALGVGFNYQRLSGEKAPLLERIKSLWQNSEFIANSGSGVRASSRVPKVIPLGRKLFAP